MTHELSSNQGWAEAGKIMRGEKKDPVTETFEKAWQGPRQKERDAELQKRRQGKKGPVMIPDLGGRD